MIFVIALFIIVLLLFSVELLYLYYLFLDAVERSGGPENPIRAVWEKITGGGKR